MAAFYPQTWEQNLLSLAHPPAAPALQSDARPLSDPALLERAYATAIH